MDREEAAHILKRYRLQSAAVVREDGYLLGALTFDDVSDILEEETEEDIRRMGGVGVEESIHDDVMEVTRSRFSWLFVNLLTAIMASLAIGMFEATLQQVVALAVLMPIVASMGGNAGTQTLTVAVRALAKKELGPSNYWGLVLREVRIGAVNGVGFAIIMGLVAWFWFEDVGIGLVIALAMVINLIAAGFSGALIPIAMRRFGIDPAVASAVFLTTITDVIGFVAFLGLATIFLF
jgi:magnesium transporter